MVAQNPLTSGKWSRKKFKATVINDIWPEVLFFTFISTMVSVVSDRHVQLGFSPSLLTVLGTVLGLVISFRTSSAYERYQEGRKLWSNIAVASRSLGQLMWIHVPIDRPDKPPAGVMEHDHTKCDRLRKSKLKAIIEKKSMVNLVQAFSVSVKHFLRGEAGIYYEDLYPIVSFLPRYSSHPSVRPSTYDTLPMWVDHEQLSLSARSSPNSTSPTIRFDNKTRPRSNNFDHEKALPQIDSEVPLRRARNPPPTTLYDYLPILVIFRPIVAGFRGLLGRKSEESELPRTRGFTGKKNVPPMVDSNIPLEITLFLDSYVQWLLKEDYLESTAAAGMMNNLAILQDTVSNLERVRSTPIPFAYQAHLRMSLWLYLFFLPFQIQTAMKYLTIPATCFASFLLLGFLEIGQEIENPFNYDANDLDMDAFCLSIQRELHEVTAHPVPDPRSYIFSTYNQPFAPSDRRDAMGLTHDLDHEYHGPDTGMHHVRRTLLRNWRRVEELARENQ